MTSNHGSMCYFPRDLEKGTYGGDVNCLQQFLRHKGYLADEPTGYYGEATEVAVKKWQNSSGISAAIKGTVDLSSRIWYAKKQGLPAPDSTLSADSKDKPGQKKTCIDVCAEFGGVQDCQTRCVRSEADKKHACREACQVAFSSACDRAFPVNADNGPQNYKICLQYLEASCKDTCQSY
mmetsp:Transcript_17062/g.32653  ORF Transcript_17062/g.32653 Transcript_17062/m.32653 type:complete len:179 (+) Transcript_17062:270-806(+)|eukprot:CAMPEP_0114255572 /NCGR_PEP_ID=MMETSP0058-20121206/17638_1 /TAXON_ID=36894 /ORGANISM="Pyramimonas parkeae, CCMP726" /LENGTH=178 /DNA_ID=CAMNT_0001369975 /DNA_START=274 /DNA_END=810 /DNA_ORIENTATION=-